MVLTKSYWQNNQTLEVVAIVKTVPNQKDVFFIYRTNLLCFNLEQFLQLL